MARISLFVLPALLAVLAVGVSGDDIFQTKSNSACATLVCPAPSFAHYYECCGNTFTDCCFKLQTWVIVVIAVFVILLAASIIISIVKCICCCN